MRLIVIHTIKNQYVYHLKAPKSKNSYILLVFRLRPAAVPLLLLLLSQVIKEFCPQMAFTNHELKLCEVVRYVLKPIYTAQERMGKNDATLLTAEG